MAGNAEKGKKQITRRKQSKAAELLMEQAKSELASAFARLTSPEEVERAFVDFLTASEFHDLQARWLIFKMLEAGVTQREISNTLGVSLCKITRGSRFLKSPRTIVRKMLAGETDGKDGI